MDAGRSGFTLIETIVAMLLSSVVVILVSGVFLVQNEYYAVQLSRSQAHDNVRMVTELIASELRPVMEDGIVVAENKRMVIRSPMAVGAVCLQQGANLTYLHMEGGQAGVDSLEVGGFAFWDGAGGWTYYPTDWETIRTPDNNAGPRCAQVGTDTTGINDHFFRLRRLGSLTGVTPNVGDVLMLYRETEYSFDTSTMDPTTVGLYRGNYGEELIEYATGMDATAGFEYRVGGTYSTSVTGADLADIDAIRIVAQARKRVASGGAGDVTYGWSVNIPLRNSS